MKRKISFGITLLLMLSLLLLALTACEEKECEHSYSGAVTKAATCESDGVMTYTCSLCTNSYTEVINALGHDEVSHSAKAPTCTEHGWNAYASCSRCDYSTYDEIPASTDAHNVIDGYCIYCNAQESTPGLKYSWNSDGKTYTLTDIGSCTEKDIVIGIYNNRNVTSIGSSAFRDCTSLTSITIPDSVTSIGSYAFYGCTSLTSITIPDGVTRIGDYTFCGCYSLLNVTIGRGVIIIGNYAFKDCTSLESVYITDIAKWCAISFDGTYSNPLYYAKNLYLNGNLVTELVIPDNVTNIGNYAFYYCTSLTSITIPNSVTSIGSAAFLDCRSLTSVTIPDSVTSIGDCAFYGCTSLEDVYITDIAKWCAISFDGTDSNPLYYAKNLYLNGNLVTELVIPDSVTSIGDDAFYGCTSLTSVTIPDSVTSIGDGAFYGCSSLTSVTIGNSVTSIGDYAFCYCYSLTSITIPDSVTSIGSAAFESCDSLTSVTIPDSVTSIGDVAFFYCYSLTSIKYSGTEEQWNAITKGILWNSNTGSYTITYDYTGE